ncbi:MAG: YggS family pyridoxal phosphate-dependent enzyme [Deltaproteobacteria bacterium]|nr:MAG: YggS family pyridoxal phosphate-dependent enzyme [Deltaproteobacteria bacterium]
MAARLAAVRARIAEAAGRAGRDPSEVRIVGVTKRHPAAVVDAAFAAGLRDAGENYAQELARKRADAACGAQVRWHFIGRLQTNKVKLVAGAVDLIHAVDSDRLAREIDRRAAAPQRVLVAVNVAGEASKSGVAPADLPRLIDAIADLPRVDCAGLMTMPPLAADPEANRRHFAALRDLRDRHLPGGELSMGTTGDYPVAVEEGATLVRIGTALFGPRPA